MRKWSRQRAEQVPATRLLTQASLSWTSEAMGQEEATKKRKERKNVNKIVLLGFVNNRTL
jgi:hypothetical protein